MGSAVLTSRSCTLVMGKLEVVMIRTASSLVRADLSRITSTLDFWNSDTRVA